jgi:hypothetical protein
VQVELDGAGGVAEVPQDDGVELRERAMSATSPGAVVDVREDDEPGALRRRADVGEVGEPQLDAVAGREPLEDVAVGREVAGQRDDRAPARPRAPPRRACRGSP